LKEENNQTLAVLDKAETHHAPEEPVVLPEPKATGELKVPQAKPPSPKAEGEVTIAPNLSDLVTGKLETPGAAEAARRGHELNAVVHRVLIVGLATSTALILTGLTLDLAQHRQVPTDAPTFSEVFRRIAQLRASGFLMLGLLVLIATPILRVIGSTLAFLYERDWRYALITFVVLLVVTLSLLLGRG
jgi:uncharacterized membrane protein